MAVTAEQHETPLNPLAVPGGLSKSAPAGNRQDAGRYGNRMVRKAFSAQGSRLATTIKFNHPMGHKLEGIGEVPVYHNTHVDNSPSSKLVGKKRGREEASPWKTGQNSACDIFGQPKK